VTTIAISESTASNPINWIIVRVTSFSGTPTTSFPVAVASVVSIVATYAATR
jgi:hypothetical protein